MKHKDTGQISYRLICLGAVIINITSSCSSKESLEDSPNNMEESSSPNIIVIFTDDQGYADLGVQNEVPDIRTPNIDNLAINGVRFTNGYVTAPVSGPSRVGIITGQYQQRFGVESNGSLNNFSERVTTLPQRLKTLKYATGLIGKAHFGRSISTMGFDDYFMHQTTPWDPVYRSTHDLNGVPFLSPQTIDLRENDKYRIDEETNAAVNFIKRHAEHPFFLYLAYTAPHVPLEATEKYLERFTSVKDEKRKLCLAMLSAVDDGVGKVMKTLEEYDINESTLVFFISDNGANINPNDIGYDASSNEPLLGEKGLLLEGGIRVPWIMYWKGTIPGGQVVHSPVISLDVASTALSLSEIKNRPDLDGINLLPYVLHEKDSFPNRSFFWYTRGQQAVRNGKWKLFRTTHKDFNCLINLDDDISERNNLETEYPEIVLRLGKELDEWQNLMETSPATEMHPVIENRLFYFINKQQHADRSINSTYEFY